MSGTAIREKLYDYIRVADDKKLRAIYDLLEDDILEVKEWWKDARFVDELDKRLENWQTGKEKGYSIQETEAHIQKLKKARAE